MEDTYITRVDAVATLYEVINSGIISDELEGKLTEIASCIKAEETHEIFMWGAEADVNELFTLKREDLVTPEWIDKCKQIHEKYKIK